jgi:hypothetical protein
MYYGSFARGDFQPGRSDIDGLIVIPGTPITDQTLITELSEAYANALKDNTVKPQFTLTDWTSLTDGTFFDYAGHFARHFEETGMVSNGIDPRPHMTIFESNQTEMLKMGHNFRKHRSGLLTARHNQKTDYTKFLDQYQKCIESTGRLTANMPMLLGESHESRRFAALDTISERFSGRFDPDSIEETKWLYEDLERLDARLRNPKAIERHWLNDHTTYESLCKILMEEQPNRQM